MPDLQLHRIQALIEIYNGEYHSHQIERHKRSVDFHRSMSLALRWNCAQGHIETVGDEFLLTEKGLDWLRAIGGVPPQD
jgi:hypothetical protein